MWSSNEEITRQNYIITAEEAAKVGLTTCHVAGTNEFSTRFLLSQPLSVRFVPYFIIWEENNLDEKLTLVKSLMKEYKTHIGIKFTNDGDFNPHTAALFEPYTDRPSTRGVLLRSQEDLNRFVLKLHKEGFQIACHCCGERCVGAIQDAYEYALKKAPRSDHRHRVEHAELVTKDLMQQAAKLGVAWAMQPNFLFYLDYTPYIGEERMKRVHPYKDILDAGVLVAAGTDCGVTPMDPILGIHILVNHRNPEQRISVKDALRLHTVNAAKIGFEEKEKGSLEPGKLADLVVLSDDPYKVPPNKIREIQVVLTMMGGRITYRNARLLEKYP
jgi:predicted amidohydrolase YtcJ